MLANECRANTMREAATEGGMNQRFAALVEKLDAKFQELLAKPPVPASNVPSAARAPDVRSWTVMSRRSSEFVP